MEEMIQEYGRVAITVLAGTFVLVAIGFSWEALGSFIIYFQECLLGG